MANVLHGQGIIRIWRDLTAICIAVIGATYSGPTHAQMRGHGGPVKALSITDAGDTLLSGSFDGSAIRWSLGTSSAAHVMRFHADAVNAVAMLRDGRAATGGADGKIALWRAGQTRPDTVYEGHSGPIASLAVSPDGSMLASASWDHTVRLWSIDKANKPRVFEGHSQNVNAVAFAPDGKAIVSVGYDLTLRLWPLDPALPATTHTLPTPLNALAISTQGEIVTAGADGKIYLRDRTGKADAEIEAGTAPVVSLSLSPDGKLLAAADVRGAVTIIDVAERKVARKLIGPGLPVWSVVFSRDSKTLITGGTDGVIRRWDALAGAPVGDAIMQSQTDPLAAYAGDRGAEVYRACIACHTLTPDQGNRAGPTLAGILGRRIATLPGYHFSEPLTKMEIVWTKETIAKLFELGPAAYTPGTKMPEQRITSEEDRKALVDFIERATTK